MNPINKEKMDRLFTEMKKAVRELRDLSGKTREELLGNSHYLGSAKYHFIVAIEAIVDICNHLIAKLSLGKPESYTDLFKILGQAGVLPDNHVETLTQMAKFRNLLVHLYWKVENERLYEILKENLDDFVMFEEWIRRFLKAE